MSLLGDLHRAYDGPPPDAARVAARLGGPERSADIADRRRALSCESMLRSVTAPQPGLVSPMNTQAELRRWRAAALACRKAGAARNLP
ncbi:MAG: hypothetical protein ACKVOI_11020 [Dongiaceae bacterium]